MSEALDRRTGRRMAVRSTLLPPLLPRAPYHACPVPRLHAHLPQFGTPTWFSQHDQLQALNMQAHANAQARSEEYVKEALVSHGAVPTLVAELLAAEAWREQLLPRLRIHLATCIDSVAAYQLLFHETVVANLLEVVLFHPEAAEAAGEEAVLELADWCARRMAYLVTDARADVQYKGGRWGRPVQYRAWVATCHCNHQLPGPSGVALTPPIFLQSALLMTC